jgi:hypothetical protein
MAVNPSSRSLLFDLVRKHKLMIPAVTIRMLNPEDRSVFDRVVPDVFDNEIDPHWAKEFLNDPRHHRDSASRITISGS